MNTKLTLNVNKEIIESAKEYAKNHEITLSQLIENYLNSLIKKEEKEIKVSPLVQSLTGVIPVDEEANCRSDYYNYLDEKYQ